MTEHEAELGPGLIQAIWRYKWLVAAAVVLGALAGYGYSASQPVLYRATSRILLDDPRTQISLEANPNYFTDLSRYVRNQALVITSDPVLARAAEKLGQAPGSLDVTADPILDVDTIDVHAVDEDPKTAAAAANAAVAAYGEVTRQQRLAAGAAAIAEFEDARDEVQRQLTRVEGNLERDPDDPVLLAERDAAAEQLQTLATRIRQLSVDTSLASSGVKFHEPATAPSAPFRPRPLRTAGAAAILALVAASAAAWWWSTRHPAMGSRQDLERILGAPRLGEIPRFDVATNAAPITGAPRSPQAEAYQFLVGGITAALDRHGGKSVLITSATPGEGKTLTALNVAVGAERDGRRVCMVDADWRWRSLTRLSGASLSVGLAQLASESVPVEWAMRGTTIVGSNMRIAGRAKDDSPDNPAEFFRSQYFARVMRRLEDEADLVVVDSPPLLAVADASEMASHVAAVVIVVDQSTPDDVLQEVRRRLDIVGATILGFVVNRTTLEGSTYSYGYGDDYGAVRSRWTTDSPLESTRGRDGANVEDSRDEDSPEPTTGDGRDRQAHDEGITPDAQPVPAQPPQP